MHLGWRDPSASASGLSGAGVSPGAAPSGCSLGGERLWPHELHFLWRGVSWAPSRETASCCQESGPGGSLGSPQRL